MGMSVQKAFSGKMDDGSSHEHAAPIHANGQSCKLWLVS